MTTLESARQATTSIQSRLNQLRRRLRAWIAVAGLGQWLWAVLGILLVDMLVDRVFRMDGSQRAIILVGMLGWASFWIYRRVLYPVTRPISDERLLLQVESRHRELRESVISSYELARQTDFESRGISPSLAAATIDLGRTRAEQIEFNDVLDAVRGGRNAWILGTALVVTLVLAVGVTQSDFLNTWFRRNLLLTSDQWPQATRLQLVGAVDGRIVVPRGADHRQLVEITEDSRITDVEVILELDAGNGASFQKMKPTGKLGGREFGFVFHSIASEYRIRARGGDGLTDWVQLSLVEPPAVLDMNLTARLPDYTGQTPQTFTGSGPHRLLQGSQVTVDIKTNKPLADCKLVQGDLELPLIPVGADRQSFRLELGGPESAAVGGKFDFRLRDDAGLANIRDFSFTIKLAEDLAPVVRGKLLGISGLIVPRAIVPVSYSVEDDYGLTQLGFETRWTSENTDGMSELSFPVKQWNGLPPTTTDSDVAVLEIERLKLTPETSFRFVMSAVDNQVTSPGKGLSREFLLRVVTEEELRADLLRREIEQRKSFQQAYDAQLELVSEVRQLVSLPSGDVDQETWRAQRQNKLVGLYRTQRGIGTSVDLVAQRFEEFLVEVQNNRLDEETAKIDPQRTIATRFEREIINPIREMDETQISAAARSIDNCRRNLADDAALAQTVAETVQIQESILDRMREIMASMESSESFQETVNRLVEIKRIEEGLRKQIEAQGDTKGIFDDD